MHVSEPRAVATGSGESVASLRRLFDPLATARGSDTSLDHQTESHNQIKNHHDFRIAPVVMHYAAGHESEQSAQGAENYSFLEPILLRDSTSRAPKHRCISSQQNQPNDQRRHAALERNLQVVRMHVAHWEFATCEKIPFAPVRFD